MARKHRKKGYYLADHHARRALGIRDIPGTLAESTALGALERFPYSVIPGVNDRIFKIEGSDQRQRESVATALFGDGRRSKVWSSRTMVKEFQLYVKSMMRHRDAYIHFVLAKDDSSADSMLVEMAILPAETIVIRRRAGARIFEQFVSAKASEGSGYSVTGGPREYFYLFSEDEMFFLRWPLGAGAPLETALRAGRVLDDYAARGLMAAHAGARPDETFLTVTRARLARSTSTVEEMEHTHAVIGDRLYRIPPTPITEYFYVDRLVRSRAAAAEVRSYVLGEFNRQVVERWRCLNGWGPVRIALSPPLLSAVEWRELGDAYKVGSASAEDIVAAAEAEDEATRALD